ILDYIQSLKRLQRRIPDITERQLCIKLWESVHVYLKMKWSDAGMTSEDTPLRDLMESAVRFEATEEIR
ncbi:hypothetical protein BDV93DRAFT_410558, partial [Ceratobasidium sp. AG-I]